MGDASMVDTVLKDGLIDAFNNIHMGITGKRTLLPSMSRALSRELHRSRERCQTVADLEGGTGPICCSIAILG